MLFAADQQYTSTLRSDSDDGTSFFSRALKRLATLGSLVGDSETSTTITEKGPLPMHNFTPPHVTLVTEVINGIEYVT